MKPAPWFRSSLALNTILLGAVAVLLVRPFGLKQARTGSAARSGQGRIASTEHKPHGSESAGPFSDAEPSIQSWLPQLRSTGIPARLLTRLVAGDFEVRWEARRLEIQQRLDHGEIDEIALARFDGQHDRERDNELRAALGEEAFQQWDKEAVVRHIVPNGLKLSAAEIDAVYQLKKSFAESQNSMTEYVQNGEIDQVECDQMQVVAQNDYERNLRAVLGDERYAAVQGAATKAAGILRRDLLSLNATDAQLTAVLTTQQQWNRQREELDRQLQANRLTDTTYEAQIQALDAARDEEYRRALGANGYDELQKIQNAQYQTMKHYATAWQLSDGDIDYLYHSLQTYQKGVADFQSRAQTMAQQGQSMDGSTMRQDIQQFSQQTLAALRSYLGDERFNKLQQNDAFALND